MGVKNEAGEVISMHHHFVAVFCTREHADPSRVAFMCEQIEEHVQLALERSIHEDGPFFPLGGDIHPTEEKRNTIWINS